MLKDKWGKGNSFKMKFYECNHFLLSDGISSVCSSVKSWPGSEIWSEEFNFVDSPRSSFEAFPRGCENTKQGSGASQCWDDGLWCDATRLLRVMRAARHLTRVWPWPAPYLPRDSPRTHNPHSQHTGPSLHLIPAILFTFPFIRWPVLLSEGEMFHLQILIIHLRASAVCVVQRPPPLTKPGVNYKIYAHSGIFHWILWWKTRPQLRLVLWEFKNFCPFWG